MAKKEKQAPRCVLCGEEVDGYGHNAAPLKDGRCCSVCNDTRVIPARLGLIGGESNAV